MSKALEINATYRIKQGLTRGFEGKLIDWDILKNKATIQVETNLEINTNAENLELVESEEK